MVGDTAQRGLVVGHRSGAGQCQDARVCIVAAVNAPLIYEGQTVLTRGKTTEDLYGGSGQVNTVSIGYDQSGIDCNRAIILDISQRSTTVGD